MVEINPLHFGWTMLQGRKKNDANITPNTHGRDTYEKVCMIQCYIVCWPGGRCNIEEHTVFSLPGRELDSAVVCVLQTAGMW